MCAACGRACGQGQRPFYVGDLSSAPEALRLIRAWGFTYKSVAFVWLKKNKKADSWFMAGLLDAGKRRDLPAGDQGTPEAAGRRHSSIYHSPIEAHSKKPDETRDKIVALMGNLPRVELFARQTSPGWDGVGQRGGADDQGLWDKLSQV